MDHRYLHPLQVHWHDHHTKPLLESILSSVQPESCDNYWQAVYLCVLEGRMEEATQLLQHLHLCQQNPEVCLITLPPISLYKMKCA